MRVFVVHAAVPGRLRCRIARLRRDRRLCAELERLLMNVREIDRASVSALTGCVIVLFAPSTSVRDVVRIVHRAVTRAADAPPAVAPRPSRPAFATRGIVRSTLSRVLFRAPPPRGTWHAVPVHEATAILATTPEGLTAREAALRLRRYGANALTTAQRSGLRILLEQFQSLPVALLGIAALLSAATGAIADAAIVLAVVGINAAVGYVTESGAERTLRSVSPASRRLAPVRRDGVDAMIAARQIAPGDVLLLRQGTVVTADARLIESDRLTVDESSLTGESLPVRKQVAEVAESTPLADRSCMVYRDTVVSGGYGRAVVVATGDSTEVGQLRQLVETLESGSSPLRVQLERLGHRLTVGSAIGCLGVFAIGVARGIPTIQMLKIAISLAVSAIPEGLPAVATTTLALGLRRLREHGVVIRQLAALETLGSMQTLCLDKTGTITENRMTTVAAYVEGSRIDLLASVAPAMNRRRSASCRVLLGLGALCTEARPSPEGNNGFVGSPTELALVDAAQASGIDVARLQQARPVHQTVHRSEGQNLMATLHGRRCGTRIRRLVVVKGSPAEVLALCARHLAGYRTRPLDDLTRRRILGVNDQMSAETLRVLGVAYTYVDGPVDAIPGTLTWVGLAAMSDRVREGAAHLVAQLRRAGVRTVMITGDQPATAAAIARRIGLHTGRDPVTIAASDLEDVPAHQLGELAARADVFARVSPSQKLQIVRALQDAGLVVGMTGDGVNDGPALKAANLGIVMGASATDVARELATVILLDDRLDRLIPAIAEGRAVFENVQRSIYFLLATNLSEMAVVAAGVAAGAREVLTARQLLWINLISDLWPSLALALEDPSADLMSRRPRDPKNGIVDDLTLVRLGFQGGVLGAGSLGAYVGAAFRPGVPHNAPSTVAFLALTAGQLLHAYNVRPASGASERNRQLDVAVLSSLALQACAVTIAPLRRIMGLVPLGMFEAAVGAIGAVISAAINGRITRNSRSDERYASSIESGPSFA